MKHISIIVLSAAIFGNGCNDSTGSDNTTDTENIETDTNVDIENDSGGDTDTDADSDTDSDTDTDTDTDSDGDNSPDTDPAATCHESAAHWSTDWATIELDVLDEVNARRTSGATCYDNNDVATDFPPASLLSMSPILQCAARVHSLWMAENATMTHDSPGGPIGDSPSERLQTAGYAGRGWAENIAAGYGTAEAVVQAWMDSKSGHCTAIMGNYSLIGVGYAFVAGESRWGGDYWTLDFGN